MSRHVQPPIAFLSSKHLLLCMSGHFWQSCAGVSDVRLVYYEILDTVLRTTFLALPQRAALGQLLMIHSVFSAMHFSQ